MNDRKSENELAEKLWDLVYGLLDAEDEAVLEERIKSEPAVARLYAEVSLRAELVASAAKIDRPPLPLHPAAAAASPAERKGSLVAGRFVASSQWLNLSVSLVAVLLLASLGGIYWPRSAEPTLAHNQLKQRPATTRYVTYSEISGPAQITAGTTNRFRVQTWSDDQTPVSTELSFSVADETTTRFQTPVVTNQQGWAEVEVPGEALRTNGRLIVSSRADAHREQDMKTVVADVTVQPDQLAAHLEIDRPIVKPGETVFFRAVTLGEESLVSQDQVETEFEIFDPQGEPVPGSRRSDTTSHGVAAGEAVLPSNAAEGYYEIVVRSPSDAFPEERLGLLVRNDGVQLLLDSNLDGAKTDAFAYGNVVADAIALRADEKSAAGLPELAKSLQPLAADRRDNSLAKKAANAEQTIPEPGDKFKDNAGGSAKFARAADVKNGVANADNLPGKRELAEAEKQKTSDSSPAKPTAGNNPPAAPASPQIPAPAIAGKAAIRSAAGPQPTGDVWFPDDDNERGNRAGRKELRTADADAKQTTEKTANEKTTSLAAADKPQSAARGVARRRGGESLRDELQSPQPDRLAGDAQLGDTPVPDALAQVESAGIRQEIEQLRRSVRHSKLQLGGGLTNDVSLRKQWVAVEVQELAALADEGGVVKLRIATTTEQGKPSSAVLGVRVVNSDVADVVAHYAPLIVDREDFGTLNQWDFTEQQQTTESTLSAPASSSLEKGGSGLGGGGLGGGGVGSEGGKSAQEMDLVQPAAETPAEPAFDGEAMILLGRSDRPLRDESALQEPAGAATPLNITLESTASPLEKFAPWLMLAGLLGMFAIAGILLAQLPVQAWAWVPAFAAASLCLVVGGWQWNRNTSVTSVAWQTPPPAVVTVERIDQPNEASPTDPIATAGAQPALLAPAKGSGSSLQREKEELKRLTDAKESTTNDSAEPLRKSQVEALEAKPERKAKLAEELDEARAAPSSIPVTVFWRPRIVTDDQGVAEISFPLPTKEGRFRIFVEAHAPGRIGKGELEIVREMPVAPVASEPAAPPSGE